LRFRSQFRCAGRAGRQQPCGSFPFLAHTARSTSRCRAAGSLTPSPALPLRRFQLRSRLLNEMRDSESGCVDVPLKVFQWPRASSRRPSTGPRRSAGVRVTLVMPGLGRHANMRPRYDSGCDGLRYGLRACQGLAVDRVLAWRNWQTQRTDTPSGASPCGSESHRQHPPRY